MWYSIAELLLDHREPGTGVGHVFSVIAFHYSYLPQIGESIQSNKAISLTPLEPGKKGLIGVFESAASPQLLSHLVFSGFEARTTAVISAIKVAHGNIGSQPGDAWSTNTVRRRFKPSGASEKKDRTGRMKPFVGWHQ